MVNKADVSQYIGKRFGLLTILNEAFSEVNGQSRVMCKCDCGRDYVALLHNVVNKNRGVVSCGCYKAKKLKENGIKTLEQRGISRISNKEPYSNNTSGTKGVSFLRVSGKWLAYLRYNGALHAKSFPSKMEAIHHRKVLEETYHDPIINEYKAEQENNNG